MKRFVAIVAVAVAIAIVAILLTPTDKKRHFAFVDELGFVDASPGWALEDDDAATGGTALVSHGAPSMIFENVSARDVHLRARCKGDCGVVFRADGRSHWAVWRRASVVEAVVVLDGKEHVLKQTPAPPESEWLDLDVEVKGDVLRVRRFFDAEAPSLPAAFGAVGLWAGREGAFDHFTIELLAPVPRSLEILPVLGKRH